MGGALTVPGNVTPGAEANIMQGTRRPPTPSSRSGVETTMIGLDVTHQAVLTRRDIERWRRLGTAAGDFLAGMTDFYIDAYSATQPELKGCGMHDPLAVAAALDPTLVTTLGMNLQVDLEGAYRGRTIGDRAHDRLTDSHKTTQVAVRVDIARFKSQFARPDHGAGLPLITARRAAADRRAALDHSRPLPAKVPCTLVVMGLSRDGGGAGGCGGCNTKNTRCCNHH